MRVRCQREGLKRCCREFQLAPGGIESQASLRHLAYCRSSARSATLRATVTSTATATSTATPTNTPTNTPTPTPLPVAAAAES